jgi:hypothetical protein
MVVEGKIIMTCLKGKIMSCMMILLNP